MRAMQSEQAELAEFVAKQHQLFAEHFDRLGDVVEIARNSNYYQYRRNHSPLGVPGPDLAEYPRPSRSC